MTLRIILTFLVIIFSSTAFSTNVRVLDFNTVIENNTNLSLLYDKINKDQKAHRVKFNNDELNLESEFDRIEKLNLILEPVELEKEIENYNIKLNNFNTKIENFNLHYQLQINNLKNTIININLLILNLHNYLNQI